MRDRPTHWNPPESVPMWQDYKGRTRCGRSLAKVLHTEDQKDVTCDRCLQLLRKDNMWGIVTSPIDASGATV
mgnify:CR=1 FL=1